MEPIILASGSPRRKEYFRLLGLPFTCMPSLVDEVFTSDSVPKAAAEELAICKVRAALERLQDKPSPPLLSSPAKRELPGVRLQSFGPGPSGKIHNRAPLWVFGADTLISLDGNICGKPQNRDDAGRMLKLFRGRTHEVITALALYNGRSGTIDCRSVTSSVGFAAISDREIEWYLDSGEWRDAAGAYKIQGLASCFISSIEGSYSSIVGLPLREFYVMLRDNGYLFGG